MIKKIVISIAIIFGFSHLWVWFYSSCIHAAEFGKSAKYVETFCGSEQHDLVYFGTSRTLFHFNPDSIKVKGVEGSFNAGILAGNTQITLAAMKAYYESHDIPEYIVVNFDFTDWESIWFNQIHNPQRFFPFYGCGEMRADLAKIDGSVNAAHYIKPYQLTQLGDWNYYDAYRAVTGITTLADEEVLSNGHELSRLVPRENFHYTRGRWEQDSTLSLMENASRSIFEWAKTKGSKLIVVIPPVYKESQALFMADSTRFKKLMGMADEYNSPVLNYYNHPIGDEIGNFFDEVHLLRSAVPEFNRIFEVDLNRVIQEHRFE